MRVPFQYFPLLFIVLLLSFIALVQLQRFYQQKLLYLIAKHQILRGNWSCPFSVKHSKSYMRGWERYWKKSSIMHGVIYETCYLILKCLLLQQNTWQKNRVHIMLCNWWSVPVSIAVKVPSTLQIVLIADNWKWHLIASPWCHLFKCFWIAINKRSGMHYT